MYRLNNSTTKIYTSRSKLTNTSQKQAAIRAIINVPGLVEISCKTDKVMRTFCQRYYNKSAYKFIVLNRI